MIELTQEELKQHFSEPIFGQISETADALGLECYVVGGYVRGGEWHCDGRSVGKTFGTRCACLCF